MEAQNLKHFGQSVIELERSLAKITAKITHIECQFTSRIGLTEHERTWRRRAGHVVKRLRVQAADLKSLIAITAEEEKKARRRGHMLLMAQQAESAKQRNEERARKRKEEEKFIAERQAVLREEKANRFYQKYQQLWGFIKDRHPEIQDEASAYMNQIQQAV